MREPLKIKWQDIWKNNYKLSSTWWKRSGPSSMKLSCPNSIVYKEISCSHVGSHLSVLYECAICSSQIILIVVRRSFIHRQIIEVNNFSCYKTRGSSNSCILLRSSTCCEFMWRIRTVIKELCLRNWLKPLSIRFGNWMATGDIF